MSRATVERDLSIAISLGDGAPTAQLSAEERMRWECDQFLAKLARFNESDRRECGPSEIEMRRDGNFDIKLIYSGRVIRGIANESHAREILGAIEDERRAYLDLHRGDIADYYCD